MSDNGEADGDTEPYTTGRFEMTSRRPFKTAGIMHVNGDSTTTTEYVIDEPHPRGEGEAPSPVMNLFGSLVGCQMSVLCVTLNKARIEDYHITVHAEMEKGWADVPEELHDALSQRLDHIDLDITLEVPEEDEARAQRCLELYDEGCIVGQSLRAGIDYTPETELKLK